MLISELGRLAMKKCSKMGRFLCLTLLGFALMTAFNTYLMTLWKSSEQAVVSTDTIRAERLLANKTGQLNPKQIVIVTEPSVKEQLAARVKTLNSYKYSKSGLSEGTEPANDGLYIEDVFIGLKSTQRYHSHRLDILLDTWIDLAKSSVHLMTDGQDEKYSKIFGNGSLYVNTKCGASHKREDLMCKLQAMYDTYMSKHESFKWFCSVDDDSYVNIPNFVKMLRKYDHNKDWYIGKPSLTKEYTTTENRKTKVSYWFATGGAAICISRALAKRMYPLCGNGEFIKRGLAISNPDDTTLGYVCNYLLKVPLTTVPELHSHLEPMWQLDPLDYHKQITISWGEVVASQVIILPNLLLIRKEIPQYSLTVDPTRVFTLHCHLFPNSSGCKRIQQKYGPVPVS